MTHTFKLLIPRILLIKSYFHISGIDVNNPDFEGRAKWVHKTHTSTTIIIVKFSKQGINLSGEPERDRPDHGTAVAGCAMSKTYGVAKMATAIAVGVEKNKRL